MGELRVVYTEQRVFFLFLFLFGKINEPSRYTGRDAAHRPGATRKHSAPDGFSLTSTVSLHGQGSGVKKKQAVCDLSPNPSGVFFLIISKSSL